MYYIFDKPKASSPKIETFYKRKTKELCASNFKIREEWNTLPGNNDLFTSQSMEPIQILNDETTLSENDKSSPIAIEFTGWANINKKTIFILSSTESDSSFLGEVGDSFKDPDFTILSFDFKTTENDLNSYPIPYITLLDQKLNKRIILAPANNSEHFK